MKITHVLMLLAGLTASYAEAQQVCPTGIPASTPTTDFTDHGDGTVTHKPTGLMWKQCLEGLNGAGCATGTVTTHTWQAALRLADGHSFATHSDWRLPNIKELGSIVELSCSSPAINLNVFPNDPGSGVWSGSPVADISLGSWYVNFHGGTDFGGGRPAEPGGLRVRLVRGPGSSQPIQKLVALGDSYSSGEGAGSYEIDLNGDDDTDDPGENTDDLGDNMCHRSLYAWSGSMPGMDTSKAAGNKDASRHNFACSGAIMSELDGPAEKDTREGQQIYHPQLNTADVISLTIGGNDLGFSYILESCMYRGYQKDGGEWVTNCDSDEYIIDVQNRLTLRTVVETNLLAISKELSGKLSLVKATTADTAKIFVFNYPYPVGTQEECDQPLVVSERTWFRELVDKLSDVIECAAAEAQLDFVDVRQKFAGFGLCDSDVSHFRGREQAKAIFTDANIQEWFHPNLLGQLDYAAEFTEAINNPKQPTCDLPSPMAITGSEQLEGNQYTKFSYEDLTVSSVIENCSNAVIPGQTVSVYGTGFVGGSEVTIFVSAGEYSKSLGPHITSGEGILSTEIIIPADIPVNDHAVIEAVGDSSPTTRRILSAILIIGESFETDGDFDGKPDLCDICPQDFDPNQEDSDGDGYGDVCDACAQDSENDIDGDGLCGDVDQCPFDADNDSDGDGLCRLMPGNDPCLKNPNLDCAFESGFESL